MKFFPPNRKPMLEKSFFSILFFLLILGCSNYDIDKFDNQIIHENKFNDSEFKIIGQFQNDRKLSELLSYFDHSNPAYREAATLAFASVQDTAALESIFALLENDKSIKVRMAASFAIGQTNDSLSEERLLKIVNSEKSIPVKDKIFEAIGKIGTKKGHDQLVQNLLGPAQKANTQGILIGLFQFSIRGIASDDGIGKIAEILSNNDQSEENRLFASFYLIRLKGFDFSKYADQLIQAFYTNENVYAKMNIVSAMSKSKNKVSFDFLTKMLKTENDYRIRINAVKSLSNFQYSEVNGLIFNLLNDSNINVSIQASEYFLFNGIKQDVELYFTKAKTLTNWRSRTNLLNAALKLSTQKNKIAQFVISEYKKSKNLYEKANLIRALGGDIESFEFVCNEMKQTKDFQISTAAIETLVEMRRSEGFDKYRRKQQFAGKCDIGVEFANVFKDAILSGDVARVGIAAEIIRDPDLDFRDLYKNSFFLSQALSNCKLPSEIETYRELQKTIAFINGTGYSEKLLTPGSRIDWDFISKIPFDQVVEINTNKGKIQVVLSVNEAPVSVGNFLKLISLGYYSNLLVHRVVPNFVVQDGCQRGDGWGSPDYTICSEFNTSYFTEGSLGLASAGKDTESGQWFITHSPTPHLDGKYTNFGKVVQGMDVVHRLEVGDTIIGIEIITEK